MKRQYIVIQDLRQILKEGEILVESPENVFRRINAKDTDGSLSREMFGDEFDNYLVPVRKTLVMYCDASYDKDTGALGVASTFNLDGEAKDSVVGDFSPTMDNNLAETHAIGMACNSIFHELRQIEFKQGDVDLFLYSDSKEAIRYIEEAAGGSNHRAVATKALESLNRFNSFTLKHIDSHKENKGPHFMSNCHVDKLAKRMMRKVRDRIQQGMQQEIS